LEDIQESIRASGSMSKEQIP